jgi:hypothetical protein
MQDRTIILIANKSFENGQNSNIWEHQIINQNCIHEEIKRRLNFGFFQGKDFRIFKASKRKCVEGIESYSTTGVPEMFPTVAASLG